jgi:hypothetical protein
MASPARPSASARQPDAKSPFGVSSGCATAFAATKPAAKTKRAARKQTPLSRQLEAFRAFGGGAIQWLSSLRMAE